MNPILHHPDSATVAALAEVKGQLAVIVTMIQQGQAATHQRIDDLRHAIEGQIKGLDGRVSELERNERSTAIKTAGIGTISSAATALMIEALKGFLKP